MKSNSAKERASIKLDENPSKKFVKSLYNSFECNIKKILETKSCDESFEKLYSYCYRLVLHECASLCYETINKCILTHITIKKEQKFASIHDDDYLAEVLNFWNDLKHSISMISCITSYLDSKYIKPNNKISIKTYSVNVFIKTFIPSGINGNRFSLNIISAIKKQRNNIEVKLDTLRCIGDMLVEIYPKLFSTYIETPLLQLTGNHYEEISSILLRNDNFLFYVKSVLHYIQKEQYFCKSCFSSSIETEIKQTIMKVMIESKYTLISDLKYDRMIELLHKKKYDNLKIVYRLYSKTQQSLAQLCDFFERDLKEYLSKCINEQTSKNLISTIQNLASFVIYCENISELSFQNNSMLSRVIRRSLETCINGQVELYEYLASYLNICLLNIQDTKDDSYSIHLILERCAKIFRYLKNKKMFVTRYQHFLAKRLVRSRYIFSREYIVLNFIKRECGNNFISKAEAMLQDVKTSNILIREFKSAYHPTIQNDAVECMDVCILYDKMWPYKSTSDDDALLLPINLQESFNQFSSYYIRTHKSRILSMIPSLCWVEAKFSTFIEDSSNSAVKRDYNLRLSLYQYIILNLFNTNSKLPYQEIKDKTRINNDELLGAVYSISLAKKSHRLLIKEPANNRINSNDIFSINNSFYSDNTYVNIPTMISKKETRHNLHEKTRTNHDQQSYIVKCKIMSLLKKAKNMETTSVVQMTLKQLTPKYDVNVDIIQMAIDSLIDGEYIERNSNNKLILEYKL